VILQSDKAMAVVSQYLPGLADDPMIGEAQRMSLRQVASFGGLSEESIEKMDAELRALEE